MRLHLDLVEGRFNPTFLGLNLRFNSHDDCRSDQGKEGRENKGRRELDSVITHPAKENGRGGTHADTDHIHEAITGCSMLRSNDLAEDGHVVAVEKSPTNSKHNHERDRRTEIRREAQSQKGRHEKKRAEGAAENAPLCRFPHPLIGDDAS